MRNPTTHTVLGERVEQSMSYTGEVLIRTTEEDLRKAELKLVKEIRNLNKLPDSLHITVLLAFLFQFVSGIGLIVVILLRNKDETRTWHWYTSYPDYDLVASEEGHGDLPPTFDHIASVSLAWIAPLFVFMSGLEHLSCLLFRETYKWYLQRSQNPFRWFEYTFTASIMRCLIAMSAGITDIHLIVCIFTLTAMTIQCGASCETVNAKARNDGLDFMYWRPFFTAWISQLVCWGIIWSYFVHGVSAGGIPSGAWGIMTILFLLDSSFAVVFSLQWLKLSPLEEYASGEMAFIVLSFTSKTFLAWLAVSGAFDYIDVE